jgi:hypothetical protein
MVYLLKAADHNWGPFGEATKTAMATAGIALLAMPALMLDRWRRPGRNRKASVSITIQPSRHRPTRRRKRDLVGRPVD